MLGLDPISHEVVLLEVTEGRTWLVAIGWPLSIPGFASRRSCNLGPQSARGAERRLDGEPC